MTYQLLNLGFPRTALKNLKIVAIKFSFAKCKKVALSLTVANDTEYFGLIYTHFSLQQQGLETKKTLYV